MGPEGKVLAVFSIRKARQGSIWVRAGWAEFKQDGSMEVFLDVLPIDGVLHIRESFETTRTLPH